MTGIENTKFGGVELRGDYIKSTQKLKDGRYQVIFKNGATVTYSEQKNSKMALQITADAKNYAGDKSWFSLNNIEGAVFTSSADSASEIEISGGKDNMVDVSSNNQQDCVVVSNSKNIKVTTDDKDKITAYMELKNTGKYKSFENGDKAGTYTYDAGDTFIKRVNVPKVLQSEYDAIAKLNGNKSLDTKDEINKFKEVVQKAFQKQQISQKEAEKIVFTVGAKPKSVHTAENYAIGGYFVGSMIGLGIPVVSQITGGVGFIAGGTIGGIVEGGIWAYDKLSGIKDQRVLDHWGVD